MQDVLTISSPGAIPVPRLCGINNGYHLYVEMPGNICSIRSSIIMFIFIAGDSCAQLSLTQGNIAATREWDITITQVVCPGKIMRF